MVYTHNALALLFYPDNPVLFVLFGWTEAAIMACLMVYIIKTCNTWEEQPRGTLMSVAASVIGIVAITTHVVMECLALLERSQPVV